MHVSPQIQLTMVSGDLPEKLGQMATVTATWKVSVSTLQQRFLSPLSPRAPENETSTCHPPSDLLHLRAFSGAQGNPPGLHSPQGSAGPAPVPQAEWPSQETTAPASALSEPLP